MDKNKQIENENKQKNIIYMAGGFLGGALIVFAIIFGGGSLLQSNLPGITTIGNTACGLTACQVQSRENNDVLLLVSRLSAAQTALNNMPSKNDFYILLSRLSAVESKASVINTLQNNSVALTSALTDVYTKLNGLFLGLNNLSQYTYSHFTEASNKFKKLGVGGLSM